MKNINLQPNEPINALGISFLGLQLYQLLNIIDGQGNQMIETTALNIPSKTASTLMLLKKEGKLSVTELGSLLNMSHQLIAHRIKPLKKKNYICEVKDANDGRKTLFELTEEGNKAADEIEKVMRLAETAYKDLFSEIGVDLFDVIKKAKIALLRKPLVYRC